MPVPCLIDKPYVDNRRFRVLKGQEFLTPEGRIKFTADSHPRPDGCYRTLFGPNVSHTGVILEQSDDNMSKAATRLTCARENPATKLPDLAWDARLTLNQVRFLQTHQQFIADVRALYRSSFDFTNILNEALEHYDDPHPKRELREHAMAEMHIDGQFHGRLWLDQLLLKMKPNEIAKPGKYPRCIGDLGVAASLQGFVLTAMLKHAQEDHPIDTLGGTLSFMASPSPNKLAAAFEKLITPPGAFFFCYFSDDSCLSFWHGGRVYRYNLDISQCDASHGDALFDAYVQLYPEELQVEAQVLIDQCSLPFRVVSRDGKERIVFQPRGKCLFSGVTITTGINNLANKTICLAIMEAIQGGGFDGTTSFITNAALSAGYMVTCVDCTDDWHHLQFLKHSPVIDTDGVLRALLNVGVLLRLSGCCDGDLPGRGDLQPRAEAFQHALLRGASPLARYTLLTRMIESTGQPPIPEAVAKRVDLLLQYRVDFSDHANNPFLVSDDEVYRRYQLEPHHIDELNEGLGTATFGTIHRSVASDQILFVDYGLTPGPRVDPTI